MSEEKKTKIEPIIQQATVRIQEFLKEQIKFHVGVFSSDDIGVFEHLANEKLTPEDQLKKSDLWRLTQEHYNAWKKEQEQKKKSIESINIQKIKIADNVKQPLIGRELVNKLNQILRPWVDAVNDINKNNYNKRIKGLISQDVDFTQEMNKLREEWNKKFTDIESKIKEFSQTLNSLHLQLSVVNIEQNNLITQKWKKLQLLANAYRDQHNKIYSSYLEALGKIEYRIWWCQEKIKKQNPPLDITVKVIELMKVSLLIGSAWYWFVLKQPFDFPLTDVKNDCDFFFIETEPSQSQEIQKCKYWLNRLKTIEQLFLLIYEIALDPGSKAAEVLNDLLRLIELAMQEIASAENKPSLKN